MPTTVTKKQKIEIGADLCAALQVISKKAPLAPRERPTYDRTLRWILSTHPGIAGQMVDELIL
jgi:hypothetical protein